MCHIKEYAYYKANPVTYSIGFLSILILIYEKRFSEKTPDFAKHRVNIIGH